MKISTAANIQQFKTSQASEKQKEDQVSQLAKKADTADTNEKIKKLAQEYESIFVSMMFKKMDKAGVKSDLIDTGMSEDVYKDMYYDELAKKAAFKNNLGIAEAMYQQLKK
ncbi:MAG: rod-binding protein [Bacillota bacterium]